MALRATRCFGIKTSFPLKRPIFLVYSPLLYNLFPSYFIVLVFFIMFINNTKDAYVFTSSIIYKAQKDL